MVKLLVTLGTVNAEDFLIVLISLSLCLRVCLSVNNSRCTLHVVLSTIQLSPHRYIGIIEATLWDSHYCDTRK